MVRTGLAFWRNDHPWIVLTDPVPTSGNILCVNLTTFDAECVDDECILEPKDYAWIKHPTAVAFSFAQSYDVKKLEMAITKGLLKLAHPSDIPAATLKKIRSIAKTARELSPDLKALL